MRRLIFPSSLLVLVASLLRDRGAWPRRRCRKRAAHPLPAAAGTADDRPLLPRSDERQGTGRRQVRAVLPAVGQRLLHVRHQLLHVRHQCCASGTACCTSGTTCCATTCTSGALTIASSPDPSTAGRKVVISGGLTSNPVSGAPVVLWRELAGQSTFHQFAQTTTDSAGQYKFTMKPGSVNADQQWYVTAAGLQSPTIQQNVNALVGLAAGAHTVTVGQPMLLSRARDPVACRTGRADRAAPRRSWAVIARPAARPRIRLHALAQIHPRGDGEAEGGAVGRFPQQPLGFARP